MNKKKTEKRNPFSISITKTGLELLRNLANKKNTSIGKLIEMLAEEKARKLKIESR
jgi:predicted DNA-binding ribbon-helix-helix protein